MKKVKLIKSTSQQEWEEDVNIHMDKLNPYKTESHIFCDTCGRINYNMVMYYEVD